MANMWYNKTIENRTGESLKHESEEKKSLKRIASTVPAKDSKCLIPAKSGIYKNRGRGKPQ